MIYDVIVVGAGASGLVAAMSAAKRGARVCILEAKNSAGKSILTSGNGRCNFSNANLDAGHYNDPEFVTTVFGPNPKETVTKFFESLGLWYITDEEGRMFPRSRAATSVLNVVMNRVKALGIEILYNAKVQYAEPPQDKQESWKIHTEEGQCFQAGKVIWCAGGGSSKYLSNLKLPVVHEQKTLCPLAVTPKPPKYLNGVRAWCLVTVSDNHKKILFKETGEVLWRPYGISGIVIFNASRLSHPGDTIELDFVEEKSEEELKNDLDKRLLTFDDRSDIQKDFLEGVLHPALSDFIMHLPGVIKDKHIDTACLAHALKHLNYKIESPADTEHAQITKGGLDTKSFDANTMSSYEYPTFYACGEVLNIDTPCGGYNLSWAWLSALKAADSI